MLVTAVHDTEEDPGGVLLVIRGDALPPGVTEGVIDSTVVNFREQQRPFTDDLIVPGVTRVRAVHFTELRARINAVRIAAGLGQFGWTDRVLSAGATRVRLVHLLELRSALAAAYAAAGRSAPRWSDASPTAGRTPIRAAHLMELRAAVVALE